MSALSDVLNAIMSLNIFEASDANPDPDPKPKPKPKPSPNPNIFEAVLSNLSFAFWPDNARAGMALLEAPAGAFRQDGTQALSSDWFKLYLAWNANFIWPSHYCADMMCLTMLPNPDPDPNPEPNPNPNPDPNPQTLTLTLTLTKCRRRGCCSST